jgi:hypothetical protein
MLAACEEAGGLQARLGQSPSCGADLPRISTRLRTPASFAEVGPATSFTGMAEGKFVLQWMKTTSAGACHVALRFGADGVCEGVTHEHDGTK